MIDIEIIEILCRMQDLNKDFKLNAESEEEVQLCEATDKNIIKQFENLYVN